MKKIWWVACLGLGLAVAAFAPKAARADGFSMGVNLGADDAAHFDFRPGHHEKFVFQAAQSLQAAKHILWNSPGGPKRTRSIYFIDQALDQLRWVENNPGARRHEKARAFRAALRLTQQAKRSLWHSLPGHAKRDALGWLNNAQSVLTRLANRPRY